MRNKTILSALLIAVLAGGLGYGISQYTKTDTTEQAAATTAQTETTADETVADAATTPATDTATETADAGGMTPVDLDQVTLNDSTPAAGEETKAASTAEDDEMDEAAPVSGEISKEQIAAEEAAIAKETAPVAIDVAAALVDRELGSKDAPLTILDYSSLTCPHCAQFHEMIFPTVKEKFIDTGKVRWVFVGFPLNEPAVKAEMVARCAPKDQYVKLIDLMFQTQQRWAYEETPVANLNLIVKPAGISEDLFISCVNNKELEAGIYAKAQDAVQKYQVSSTPTFIFNDGAKKISGVGTVEGFTYDVERFLEEMKQTTPKKLDPKVYDVPKK